MTNYIWLCQNPENSFTISAQNACYQEFNNQNEICILVKEELLSNQGMASHTFKRRGLAEFNQLQIQILLSQEKNIYLLHNNFLLY